MIGLALLFSMAGVLAQDTEESDEMAATMRLMDDAEAALPDAVTRAIVLPRVVSENVAETPAEGNVGKGLSTANEKAPRRQHEPQLADNVRENAAEMAGKAQEDRENRGRSEDRPEPPGPPDRN